MAGNGREWPGMAGNGREWPSEARRIARLAFPNAKSNLDADNSRLRARNFNYVVNAPGYVPARPNLGFIGLGEAPRRRGILSRTVVSGVHRCLVKNPRRPRLTSFVLLCIILRLNNAQTLSRDYCNWLTGIGLEARNLKMIMKQRVPRVEEVVFVTGALRLL
jgi:hypothetical protein